MGLLHLKPSQHPFPPLIIYKVLKCLQPIELRRHGDTVYKCTFSVTSNCYMSFFSHHSFALVCSEGGGQHAGHHHSLSCGRSHRSVNGLHVAQELHSVCSCQDGGEKVSFHRLLDIYQQCNHFTLFHQSTLSGLDSMFFR